jgi:hypothetical protein
LTWIRILAILKPEAIKKMSVDNSAEIIKRPEAHEKPVNVSFRVGTSSEGLPEYLSLPYDEVVRGTLTKRQALSLLKAAEFGTHRLRVDLMASKRDSNSHTVVPFLSLLESMMAVYRSLSGTINREVDESAKIPRQRKTVQDIFTICKQRGMLNVDLLTGAVEAEFLDSQQKEKTRQEIVERRKRLNRLGFVDGFAGTITGIHTQKGFIEFPYIDHSLPEEKRWYDAAKRAEEAGFTFDEKGRVAGFETEDGKKITIPEADRSEQIRVR